MHRTVISIVILTAIVLVAAACSGTSNTTRPPDTPQKETAHKDDALPDWFGEESVMYDSSAVQAYAGAIGPDAASAEAKAAERATTLLKRSISGRLEAVRAEAVQELGMEAGLANADFLVDLRKADGAVDETVTTLQTGTMPVEGQSSMRGLAAVELSKEELIEQLNKRMSAHAETWNAMKQSGAFQEF
ncbi:hypothetical protein SAMN05443144_108140 [Fodinibius roseus]|uniref:LPP20 lipoprotein n=1 Tax=Fodinibius roseus TaxID=1194090 RepID=A0A1M5BIF1_9BACT|nr:hypothetical protein [Fodinibius roseus]SHF42403.1 hypothetical protein SAMN05443144_108140 [Fodinibius roseus]